MFKTVKVIDHARKEVLNETKRSNQIFLISKGGGGRIEVWKILKKKKGGKRDGLEAATLNLPQIGSLQACVT